MLDEQKGSIEAFSPLEAEINRALHTLIITQTYELR